MATTQTHPTIYLKDYAVPDFLIDTVDLCFDIHEDHTTVTSKLTIERNPLAKKANAPLVLQGRSLELLSLALNDEELTASSFQCDQETLTISTVPTKFQLTVETKIKPHLNTALTGLYQSHDLLCTQCEAHGFRNITYFLDRPDVMARYKTTIIADKKRYPVLLSNGNIIDQGQQENSRHWVTWQDPFKKPCYLFALVAGHLDCYEDTFTTMSGRKTKCQIYVEPGQRDKCQHAMISLKKAMAWDEKVYGREYDLDIFMIVAVNDFNAGAMENKGLNIFNAKYILAKPETATDSDYENIEAVVAHEYFHNWTGNRITCRDWFQLSLKEGLTVFREQEFMRDMTSRDVKRIHDVQVLWNQQFTEDASPTSHPVQPDHYIEVNNFYTPTIYNKGAEVIRMIATLLGPEEFRNGMDLYFERHDGQAVTIEDFVRAFEDANKRDLKQFRLWYHQAGTPALRYSSHYSSNTQSFELTLEQSYPATDKKPLHIPVAIALLDKQGNELSLCLEGETKALRGTKVLELKDEKQTFRFINVTEKPVLSLLRDFSAPVKVMSEMPDDELLFLIAHDSNGFVRWNSAQTLLLKTIFSLMNTKRINASLIEAYQRSLQDETIDSALKAHLLMFPDENYIADLMSIIDMNAIHQARKQLQLQFAQQLKPILLNIYKKYSQETYSNDAISMANRSLKNGCLALLMKLAEPTNIELCIAQFNQADNMSDQIAALSV